MLVISTIHLIFLQSEAWREERHLTAIHGQTYQDYCAKTGGFLPRF